MKYALSLLTLIAASPALAHPGAHLHSDSVEGWALGLGLLAIAGAVALGLGRRG